MKRLMLPLVAVGILSGVGIVGLTAFVGMRLYPTAQRQPAAEPEAKVADLPTLYGIYKADPARFQREFIGRRVEFSFRIDEVSLDRRGVATLTQKENRDKSVGEWQSHRVTKCKGGPYNIGDTWTFRATFRQANATNGLTMELD